MGERKASRRASTRQQKKEPELANRCSRADSNGKTKMKMKNGLQNLTVRSTASAAESLGCAVGQSRRLEDVAQMSDVERKS